MEILMKYWVPSYKWQLVQALHKRYPYVKWNRFSKKVLMAIYLKERSSYVSRSKGITQEVEYSNR